MMDKKELNQALRAISEGYEYEVITHTDGTCFVFVVNPNFQEDNGSNFHLLFEVKLDD